MRKTNSNIFKNPVKSNIRQNMLQVKTAILDQNLNPQYNYIFTKNDIKINNQKFMLVSSLSNKNLNLKPYADQKVNQFKRNKHPKSPQFYSNTSIMLTQPSIIIRTETKPEFSYNQIICEYLRYKQTKYTMRKNFMNFQYNINNESRKNLIQWMIQVHQRFHLISQTLFIAVNIVDRIIGSQVVQKNQLQLLGLTALFISSKIQQIQIPNINSFINICENLIPKEDVIKMESKILSSLSFDLGYSSPLHILNQLLIEYGMTESVIEDESYYFCKLMLLESNMSEYKASTIALTCFFLSFKRKKIELPLYFMKRINKQQSILEQFIACRNDAFEIVLRLQNGKYENIINILRKKNKNVN